MGEGDEAMNHTYWNDRRKLGYIKLSRQPEAAHFKRGMTVMVNGHVVRVKGIDRENGDLVVHSPLWWRAMHWTLDLMSRVFGGQ
jgi:hypothetical protein